MWPDNFAKSSSTTCHDAAPARGTRQRLDQFLVRGFQGATFSAKTSNRVF